MKTLPHEVYNLLLELILDSSICERFSEDNKERKARAHLSYPEITVKILSH